MTKSDIILLLQKHASGEAFTEEEEALFTELERDRPAMAEALTEIFLADEQQESYDKHLWEPILSSVLSLDKNKQNDAGSPTVAPVHRVHFLRKWGWVAASLIFIVGMIAYFQFSQHTDKPAPETIAMKEDVLPGKEGAILTLADGSQVSLDTLQNGMVSLQGGARVKVVNGVLTYEKTGDAVVYNTMSTPPGRLFHLALPDGTRVWLNAASSIRYPTVFTGSQRLVEINGEAYFEVTHNKAMPFLVAIGKGTSVQVLGTSFNINSYDNESNQVVTLLEGKVKVVADNQSAVLKPAQQAQIDKVKQAGISVTDNVDVQQAIAWKNGAFAFQQAGFAEVMRQLERWYNVKVEYQGAVPKGSFNGEIGKNLTLTQVLDYFADAGIKYKIEKERLIILQ